MQLRMLNRDAHALVGILWCTMLCSIRSGAETNHPKPRVGFTAVPLLQTRGHQVLETNKTRDSASLMVPHGTVKRRVLCSMRLELTDCSILLTVIIDLNNKTTFRMIEV